jgi:PAS domain S-box-containing protein
VLVIEDDADTRANLCDILELDDFQVDAGATAAEALAYASWPEVSIVILDRRLPDGNALELLPVIKELAPQASVVVVTGHADMEGVIAALRHGASDFLLKPVNADVLRASLSRIVAGLKAQQALENSGRRLSEEQDFAQKLWDTAETILLLLDKEGRILRFNPYLEKVAGYPLAGVRGSDWFETFLPAEDRPRIRRLFHEVLESGGIDGNVNDIVTKEGLRREIHWRAKVLKDADENIVGVLSAGQDITDLRRAQERALQRERLAAIGETMAGLVHESGNALQRTRACLEMLMLEVEDRPEALELAQRALKAQTHLHQQYEEVRQYAAPVNLRRSRCNLAETWRETWEHLKASRGEKQLELREEVGNLDLCCSADRIAIGQVWRNILENAIQVSPNQGVITVRCHEVLCNDKPAVSVSIRDQGPGLTPEQRRRIFEPFYTTKTKGTGLGMAIVQRIVLSHGGAITLGSENGPGAEIEIILPRGAI